MTVRRRSWRDVSTTTINITLGLLFAVAALAVALIRPDMVGAIAVIPSGWRVLLALVFAAVLVELVWVFLCNVLPLLLDDGKPGRHRRGPGRRRVAA